MITPGQMDIADSVEKYGHAYDPASDDYRRPPFAEPVKASKSSAIYRAHSYHTKVPPEGIIPYIEHYTSPGDLVLDPFCGSGMTGVACLLTGRHAILNDLSPAAAHIAYNYCTPVDLEDLKSEFERIKAAVREEFDWLYGTTCDRCGGPATIQYTVWSDVFECARCGGDILLWEAGVDHATGKVSERFDCPTCQAEWRKTDVRWVRSVPVVTGYHCEAECEAKRIERPVTNPEMRLIAEIEQQEIPRWYPTIPFDDSWEMWRAAHRERGITNVGRFYVDRSLRAMATLWSEIQSAPAPRSRQALEFCFTAIAQRCSKLNRLRPTHSGDPLTGTLYVGALVREENVGSLWARKADSIRRVLSSKGDSVVLVDIGSANALRVPESAVDYAFTDPPFGSNIFYADCNLIWESWLGQLTDESHEAVVHVKHKEKNTLPDYARLMKESFQEMYRVLKPGRWASVVFHNSDDRIWQVILGAAEAAGFELAEINAFDKTQLSFKGVRGAKGLERVTNQDIVLNLLKRRPGSPRSATETGGANEVEALVVERVADYLATDPSPDHRSLQYLWNQVLYEMIRNGAVTVNMAQVGDMLPHYFKEVDGRWYLRGEAVVGGNVFDLSNDTGAIAWLTAVLGAEPQTAGDLIPKWQQITGQLDDLEPARLDRLLADNFWHDERSGRWRVPTTAEREKMSARQDLSALAHLRTIRRFLEGSLDRTPGDMELGAWLRFCYNHGFYSEGSALFLQMDESRLDPQDYARLKRMATVCNMKARG